MANYRAGDVIRLTRNAIGMTQEQLIEGICSVETLSRIENNRQGIGIEVYELLMAKMERNPLRSYAICSSTDMRIAEEKKELEDAVAKVDYEKAKGHLLKMESMMSATNYNQQYLARFEALIAYHTKEIDEKELIERLDKAIRLTLPEYEKYLKSENVFPFTEQELMTLMSLANAYILIKDADRSLYIFRKLIYCTEQSYMDDSTVIRFRIVAMSNYIKHLGEMEYFTESLRVAKETLKIAKTYDYGHVIPNLMSAIAWNKLKMDKQQEKVQNEEKEIKKILRQAYYIACARYDKVNVKLLKDYFSTEFDEQL